jgi:hypothetical protein
MALIKSNHGYFQLGDMKYKFDSQTVEGRSVGIQTQDYKLTFDVQAQTDLIQSFPSAEIEKFHDSKFV